MSGIMPLLLRLYPLRFCLTTHISQYPRSLIVGTFSTCSRRQSASQTASKPLLRAVRNDASVEDISKEDLFRYTRHRWVYNESRHLSKRFLSFDLQKLLQAAVSATWSEGVRYCTEVLKCKEGLNNKAYLLRMNNGSEIFAKLPNPCAGPAFYTTASEVVTREFLRDALGIPTPRIIAWCADRNNPVGAEYILEEKASGKPLGSLWQDWDEWPVEHRYGIIELIVEIERKLASIKFTKSGCIFFKKDFPDGDALVISSPLCSSVLERFVLGSLVESGHWRGKRTTMSINRGPYNGPLEFVKAMAENEAKFVRKHGRPRMNYARSLENAELPDEMLDLLRRYLLLAPAMVPPESPDDTHSPTLWHPDLHLDNVIADPESKEVTHIIDWQSSAVLPLFYQCGVARMFKHLELVSTDMTVLPKRPEGYSDLEKDEKDKIDALIKSECLLKYYLLVTHNRNQRHWAAIQLQEDVRTQPIRLVQNAWEDEDTFFLRRALMRIVTQWEDLCPYAGPCPVSFDEEEIALHMHEEENRGYVSEILTLFRDKWGLSPSGEIESARFEEIQTELKQMRDAFVESAEEDRLLAEKLWPYQDSIVD